jgi:hypothetical protein
MVCNLQAMFGDPSFFTSKAPPGGKSDKKFVSICIFAHLILQQIAMFLHPLLITPRAAD